MKMTFQEVADRFEAVLSGTVSREDADRWAWQAMQAGDRNDLDFAPSSEPPEARTRSAVDACG